MVEDSNGNYGGEEEEVDDGFEKGEEVEIGEIVCQKYGDKVVGYRDSRYGDDGQIFFRIMEVYDELLIFIVSCCFYGLFLK